MVIKGATTEALVKKYIVSDKIFADHSSYADAEAERQRLREVPKNKNKNFYVYCVLERFQNYEDIPL